MKTKIFALITVISVLAVMTTACSSQVQTQYIYNIASKMDSLIYNDYLQKLEQDNSDGENAPSQGNGSQEQDPPQQKPPEEQTPVQQDILVQSLTNSLNVRTGKGTGYPSIGTLDKGDMVAFISLEDGWYKTIYKQQIAYVSANANYTTLYKMDKGNDKVESVIEVGKTLLGFPYVWGSQRYHWGNGILNTNFVEGEFDCSALTQYAYYKGAGVLLDLTTRTQVLQGKKVQLEDLKRGDLMFFTNSSRKHLSGTERVGHVAIYLGDNYILHTASDHAVIEEISATRWSYYIESRRFV